MSGGHAHALHVHAHSPLHAMAPHHKIAAMAASILAIVVTPREQFWAFGAYGLIVLVLLGVGEIPIGFYLRRVVVEAPFVAFAVLLPFFGGGERVDLVGLDVSLEGLWAAWNILAKATLGVSLSIVLAATTEIPDILRGLDRLRVPRLITAIAGFMVRYLDVLASELSRARVAMTARGHDPRFFWQARPLAVSAGALFVRSFERGERIHHAMLARGFDGVMPDTSIGDGGEGGPVPAVMLVAAVWTVMTVAVGLTLAAGS